MKVRLTALPSICSSPAPSHFNPDTSEVTPSSHQGLQFRVINEVELRDEVVVVLVAGIDMGLCTHAADTVKVMDVNMYKDSEETTQDLLAHLLEVLGERYTWSKEGR